jgi:hypothetical protein
MQVISTRFALLVLLILVFASVGLAVAQSASSPPTLAAVSAACFGPDGERRTTDVPSSAQYYCYVMTFAEGIGIIPVIDGLAFVLMMVFFVSRALGISLDANPGPKMREFLVASVIAFMLTAGLPEIRSLLDEVHGALQNFSSGVLNNMAVELIGFSDTIKTQEDAIAEADMAAVIAEAMAELDTCTGRQHVPVEVEGGVVYQCQRTVRNADGGATISFFHALNPEEFTNPDFVGLGSNVLVGSITVDENGQVVESSTTGVSINPEQLVGVTATSAAVIAAKGRERTAAALKALKVGSKLVPFAKFIEAAIIPVLVLQNMITFGASLVFLVGTIILPLGAIMLVLGSGSAFFSLWSKTILGSGLTLVIFPIVYALAIQVAVIIPVKTFLSGIVQRIDSVVNIVKSCDGFVDCVTNLGVALGAAIMGVFETFGAVFTLAFQIIIGLITALGLISLMQTVIIKFVSGVFASAKGLSVMQMFGDMRPKGSAPLTKQDLASGQFEAAQGTNAAGQPVTTMTFRPNASGPSRGSGGTSSGTP